MRDDASRLQRARRVVSWAAWLVPACLRDEWRAEWNGELTAWMHDGHRRLLRHALGAFSDAWWIRQREFADAAWIDDLRHGWRQLRDHAGFAVVAVGVLAVGMAASVVAFSVVSQILLRPLPYPELERVVTLWERHAGEPARLDVAPGNFLDWRDRATAFETLAGAEPYSRDYTDADRPEVWKSLNVTEGFFEALGVRPLLGRWFTPGEYVKGRHHVVILSARVWRSRFNASGTVVGRKITLDGEPVEIVGVMPDDFLPHLLEDVPGQILAWAPKPVEEFERRIRAGGYWQVVGRLAPGRTLESARAELAELAAGIELEQPRTNRGSRVDVVPLREHLVGDVRSAVRLFTAAVGVVLLIACVNVTNLLLARGASRTQELAVRHALGASRPRLIAQMLTESLLLSSLAAGAALLLTAAAMRALATLGPADVLWIDSLVVDWRAITFAALLAVSVAATAGVVPALRLSGIGARSATRTATADAGHRRLRSGLVIAEVALALVLVSGASLLLRSFMNLLNVETGFQRASVSVLQVFAWDRNPGPDGLRNFFDAVVRRVATLPGVDAVGLVTAMPFVGANIDVQSVFAIAGDPAPAVGEEPRASFNVASPGYFRAMGIRVVSGRALDERDRHDGPRVVVISEALADRYFRGRDPIGRRLTYRSQGKPLEVEIVGVVASVRHERLEDAPRMEVLRPFAQAPSGSMTIVARTAGDAGALIEAAKRAIWEIDPLQAFYQTATLDELVRSTVATRRFVLVVLAAFAGLALLLSGAGLYGVLTAIAAQQQREIGVRFALGATWLDVMRLVLGRGLALVSVGVAAGVAGALGSGRLLTTFLFGVTPADPWTIGGAAAVMVAVAVPACLVPARRAASTSPVEVLRAD